MMVPPGVVQAGFRLMVFLFVMAVLVMVWARPGTGSAGFVITVFTMVVTGGVAAGLAIIGRLGSSSRNSIPDTPDGEDNQQ